MNGLLKYSFPICFSLLALFACEDDGIDVDNIEVPAGFALSAGTATNFLTSSYAYDRSADWITGAYDKRFTRGDKLYDDIRTSSNGIGGGLGPVYAGYSCGSCHRNAGRTQPTLWSEGGSGSSGFSSMLVYISRKNGAFFQDYGRVLHDQAIYGVKPEGKLKVEYTYETFQFPDGETYELCKPNYSIYEWYADKLIQTVLRSYTGVFTDYTYINEDSLAIRTGLTRRQIYEQLVHLAKLRIVSYIPRKKTPYIIYTRERIEAQLIHISPEIYEERKARYETRINAMLEYVTNDTLCRSRMLLDYFGEKNEHNCGQCDTCIGLRKQTASSLTLLWISWRKRRLRALTSG